MKTYQFMQKETVVIHLESGTQTFESEQSQLLMQGFELTGEPIEAESVEAAYDLHSQKYGDSSNEYPLLGTLSEVPQALALRAILGG
ncbi:hypothetical protein [Enterovibrio norvegicus]|uniref:hypothetical protein n=1 Tax=Enterovibrio norvegicus TaxID=188144 RepID=UPI0024B0E0CC|nr:hypothetical protein [Enterovibrio norvegicus]